MKWSVPISIDRFQICPSVAKELEAGRGITLKKTTPVQPMKRRLPAILIIACIWRHTFRKQSPERVDVTGACGNVYVFHCHPVSPREQQLRVRPRAPRERLETG